MRFETVNAFSFGALKSAELKLAPGLYAVWGPNEAWEVHVARCHLRGSVWDGPRKGRDQETGRRFQAQALALGR